MSLVGDYELADDGKWYGSAVIGVANEWYICFDDDDPPELVIRNVGKSSKPTQEPDAIIRKYNLPFDKPVRQGSCGRMMPNEQGKWKVVQATSYFLKMTGPIPAKLILKRDGVWDERPNREGVYYSVGKS